MNGGPDAWRSRRRRDRPSRAGFRGVPVPADGETHDTGTVPVLFPAPVATGRVNRARALGAVLTLAVGIGLQLTISVEGYWAQVGSALVTLGLALAAIVALVLSLDRMAGETAGNGRRGGDSE